MKTTQIKALGDAELAKELESAHKELFNLRFRLATKQLANHRELPKTRKKIARLYTILRQRQLGI
ncbi:MAG: 50S ribosomal protein L29 [Dehalococcoidia bacterium]|nr:50S ribosomal protein L29 [Dehalococcoidia bacterium]